MNMNSEKPPLLAYLEKKGITLEDLISTALELFVPHPGLETEATATEMFKEGRYSPRKACRRWDTWWRSRNLCRATGPGLTGTS